MTNTATGQKLCQKCGRDVTHERRMKDGKGRYWCADCGVGDAAASGSALISPCPKCGTPTHAASYIRHGGVYVCESCASGGKRGGAMSDEDRSKRTKAILGVALIILGIALYFGLNT